MTALSKDQLLKALRSRALRRGEFKLASGKTSDWYVNVKALAFSSDGAPLLGGALYVLLKSCFKPVSAVGGLELGAVPLTTAILVAADLDGIRLSGFAVRKQAKDHGTRLPIEGLEDVPAGSKVVVVEDVVTSGASAVKAAEAVIGAGYSVAGVIAVVDRREGGREAIARAGLQLYSLFNDRDFL